MGVEPVWGERLTAMDLFDADLPVTLDLGFGMAESILERARREPERGFLGVEVHRPGIATAVRGAAEENLRNVRIVKGDGLILLRDYLSPHMMDEVCLFFPDPFPRQPARRLFQDIFLDIVASRIRPGGRLHLATDVAVYAEWATEVASRHPLWRPHGLEGPELPRPAHRPFTGYERRARDAGREVCDLQWQCQAV